MKDVTSAINQMSTDHISTLESGNSLTLKTASGEAAITLEDVEISYQDIPGWLVASEGTTTVALDITLSDELRQEGIARDLVNRVQNMRKDMGLEVQDKIKINVELSTELVNAALKANEEYICEETQAFSLTMTETLSDGVLLEMDEHKLKVKIEA